MTSHRNKFVLATISLVASIGLGALVLRWGAHSFCASLAEASEGYEVVTEVQRISYAIPAAGHEIRRWAVDGKLIRKIEERCLDGFIDWHYAYRIECESSVMAELVSAFGMVPRPDSELRTTFREVFPEVGGVIDQGVAVLASSQFSHIGRGGPDGDHFAALYDETTSRLYLWAHFNF